MSFIARYIRHPMCISKIVAYNIIGEEFDFIAEKR